MIPFRLDPQSQAPVPAQIKQQIKFALIFDQLRPGDALPSIRELARELGIGTGVVRRAYGELAQAGILSVSPSKRIVVTRDLGDRRGGQVLEEARRLAAEVADQAVALGVHPYSFAQFLQHWLAESRRAESLIAFTECNRLQAQQYAEEAARAWGVPVRGLTFDELRRLAPAQLKPTRHLLTVPYHYEEARELARRFRKRLVTVSVHVDPDMLRRIDQVGPGGRVAFVWDQADYESYGRRAILDEMRALFPGERLEFSSWALPQIEPLDRWMDEGRWDLVFVSNRLWDALPAPIRSRPNVALPRQSLDPLSAERARLELGIFS